jgi:hypothetical protein
VDLTPFDIALEDAVDTTIQLLIQIEEFLYPPLGSGRREVARRQNIIEYVTADGLVTLEDVAQGKEIRLPGIVNDLSADVESLYAELEGAIDFTTAQSFPMPGLLETLSDFLLNPSYDASKPCLAPAPLLSDLLDMALGKVVGVIDATVAKVGQSVWDWLLPAGIEGDSLTGFVESVLADPVTAALNFVLGQRDRIDCVVTGEVSVGENVLEMLLRRLQGVLAEALA